MALGGSAVSTPPASGRHRPLLAPGAGLWAPGVLRMCACVWEPSSSPAALSGHPGGPHLHPCPVAAVHAEPPVPFQRGHQRLLLSEALKRRGARPSTVGEPLGPEVLPMGSRGGGRLRPQVVNPRAAPLSSAVTGDRGGCWGHRHCQRRR